jgi:hypothetical protein
MGRLSVDSVRRNGTFLSMNSSIPSGTAVGGRELNLVRPRYLAVAFGAYFAIVAYLAWTYARASKDAWFTPDIARTVYQTTMVGGVLILIGLFVTASILPHFGRVIRPRSVSPGFGSRDVSDARRPRLAFPTPPPRTSRSADPEWTVDGLLEDSGVDPSRYVDRERQRDAAAVSAALSRILPRTDSTNPGTLIDRLSGIRARTVGPLLSEDREMTQVLLRLVNEIKPLLVAAKKAGINVPEIRKIVAEATAGREGDLAYRVHLVEQLKDTLEAALVERIADDLQNVLVDIEKTKAASLQVHSAELTAAEGVALLDTGNYLAALERATRARNAVATQLLAAGPVPNGDDWIAPGPASYGALVGPSIMASIYVAIGAMLLPAVDGFLVTNFVLNTGAILFLSYGWFGLILYALASVYALTRPQPDRPRSRSREFDFNGR